VGDGGHGRGLFQIDDRFHGRFLENHNALASGAVPPVRAAALYAARILRHNHTRYREEGVPGWKIWRVTTASYNAGYNGALFAYKSGGADRATTGGDYAKDVMSRRKLFVKLLHQQPLKRVKEPTVELDVRHLVQGHGFMKPVRIILHSTESGDTSGTIEMYNIAKYWSNLGFGAHITVDADGNTARNLADVEYGWHTGGANSGSLGIEQVGYARFTTAQWKARPQELHEVAKWIAWWSKKYDIPIRFSTTHGVSKHVNHPAGGHWDPGPGYPFDYVLKLAREYKKNGFRV
jgi:hypothetical protein